ncbi:hypothetical protein BDS110ZK14_65000 [Bradyrhizobium diazoefficiens]|nr:hypothetical protein XF15B_05800 [Bradyrhizobium diazoefficiens]
MRRLPAHIVTPPFLLALVADGSGAGTEASPLVRGGIFEIGASAPEEGPETAFLDIGTRDVPTVLRTLGLGTGLTLSVLDKDLDGPAKLSIRLPGDRQFKDMYERLRRSV